MPDAADFHSVSSVLSESDTTALVYSTLLIRSRVSVVNHGVI